MLSSSASGRSGRADRRDTKAQSLLLVPPARRGGVWLVANVELRGQLRDDGRLDAVLTLPSGASSFAFVDQEEERLKNGPVRQLE